MKNVNMDIWLAGTLNELLMRDSYTQIIFHKKKRKKVVSIFRQKTSFRILQKVPKNTVPNTMAIDLSYILPKISTGPQ